MAERRMFAKTIIDSDAFLDMPQSTQLLYFHLSMRGDDDGFVNKPKTIMRVVGCKDDDLKLLIAKKFVIGFETGVIVIKHWKIHNYIRNDRYNETKYIVEKSTLELDENNAYRQMEGIPQIEGIPTVDQWLPQVRLGKDRLGKVSIGKDKEAKTPGCFSENENLNQAIQEYVDFRKTLKKPMTDKAIKMLITKLNKLTSDVAKQVLIIEQSIFKGWTDVYELKENGGANVGGNGGNKPKDPRKLEEWEIQQIEQARQLAADGKLDDEEFNF